MIQNLKILILTMSCNQPYFQGLLGAVKDTWAKPIIQGRYNNVMWFGYTSCDNHHPKPCIDFNEHMIYVDSNDELGFTYDKTQKAYELIKNVLDFNYVVRTNTSLFVNVDKLIEHVNSLDDRYIMGRFYNYHLNNKFYLTICGFFFGMSKYLFDISMTASNDYVKDENGNSISFDDDRILTKRLFDVIDLNSVYTTDVLGIIQVYKGISPNDISITSLKDIKELQKINVTDNPDVINDNIMVRVRTLYSNEDRIEKGHEIEHMYELYNVLKK